MKLLIIRHALAEDPEEFSNRTGLDDSHRPLTPIGRDKMRKTAKGLCTIMPYLQLIAVSPYQRAIETGELLHEYYPKAKFVQTPVLSPGAELQAVSEWLQQQNSYSKIAVVGHEPGLSQLASWFLSGKTVSFLRFKKGAACLLDIEDLSQTGIAELQWFIAPGQLRALARVSE